MARIRTVKPDLFRHERLYDAERATGLPLRLAFIGLFTVADREGRFPWRPAALKLDCLPYDELDFARVLDALAALGFITRHACPTRDPRVPHASTEVDSFGVIPTFRKHQVINTRERNSELPDPADCEVIQCDADACLTRASRVTETHVHAQGEGKGREGEKEGEGKRKKVSAPDGALELFKDNPGKPNGKSHAPKESNPDDPETALFRRGKELFGSSGGALIKRLLTAKGGNVSLARAVIETASTKFNPREYVGASIRNADTHTGTGSAIV